MQYQNFEIFKHFCQTNQITIIQTQFEEIICCNIETTTQERELIMQKKDELNIQKVEILKRKNIRKNNQSIKQ